MAKLHLTFTPKKQRPFDNTALAQAIKLRSMTIDYSKNAMVNNIIAEVTKAITDSDVKSNIAGKDLEGTPAEGKNELYLYVLTNGKKEKAAKIDLTIEPEPKFDIKKECPLFANPGDKKVTGDGYYGGADNQPHVHFVSGNIHVKLGGKRQNIVKGVTVYEESMKSAHEQMKGTKFQSLAPWVAAALKKLGHI